MAFYSQYPPMYASPYPMPFPNQEFYPHPHPHHPMYHHHHQHGGPPHHPHHHPMQYPMDGPVYYSPSAQMANGSEGGVKLPGKHGYNNRKDSSDSGISDYSVLSSGGRKVSSTSTVSSASVAETVDTNATVSTATLEDVKEENMPPYEEPDDDLCEKIVQQVTYKDIWIDYCHYGTLHEFTTLLCAIYTSTSTLKPRPLNSLSLHAACVNKCFRT